MTRIASIVAGAVSLIIISAGVYVYRAQTPDRIAETAHTTQPASPSPTAKPAREASAAPALYCQFYVFVESQPFVAFLFELDRSEPPSFAQVYVAKANGERTDYDGAETPRPRWTLDQTAEPARLVSRTTVPSTGPTGLAEEDIAIELYGFDPAAPGLRWVEASLRSVYYQNLPGKCRLANV